MRRIEGLEKSFRVFNELVSDRTVGDHTEKQAFDIVVTVVGFGSRYCLGSKRGVCHSPLIMTGPVDGVENEIFPVDYANIEACIASCLTVCVVHGAVRCV